MIARRYCRSNFVFGDDPVSSAQAKALEIA
jgi:hypothetical protein